ncbi:MAG: hypothetical protein Q9225_006108 [Loekoesia sp. 1 TL-2023]
MAEGSLTKRPSDAYTDAERMDISRAIAMSLASPRSNLQMAQDRSIPQSEADWDSYRRQEELVEAARKRSSIEGEEEFGDLSKGSGGPDMKSQGSKTQEVQDDHSSPKPDSGNSTPKGPDFEPSTTEDSPEESSSSPRDTIEDRIKEMELGNPVDLPWIDDDDGDTWVFIDPAAQQPEQTDRMYEAYKERYGKPLTIKSITLRQLQSSFFDKLLGPNYQHRIVRRRVFKGKLLKGNLPMQIKYVIDLTPPTEGDEAAWLTSELCCIDGLRNWSQAEDRWQVSKTLVGGRDEFTAPPANTKEIYPVPEISPIRHRACIERFLNAIRNIDPSLDSAVKVYTTFVVARFFDVTRSPLTDYIIRWFRAAPNSRFIEAFPEVALKIGDGLQCLELIRDSFAILVGEEALELMRQKPNPGYTVYGRKKNDIPESYKTRIEYASKNLQGRVSQIFEGLVARDMMWMENLPEFKKLLDNDDKAIAPLVAETRMALKAYERGAIFDVLYSDLTWSPGLWLGANGGDSLYPRTSQHSFWNGLDPTKRIMTATFWQALKQSRSSSFTNIPHTTNLTAWSYNASGWGSHLSDANLKTLTQEYGVAEIRYSYLRDLTARCCKGQTPSSTTDVGSLKPLEQQPPDFWDALAPSLPTVTSTSSGMGIVLMQACLEIMDYISSVCDTMISPQDVDRTEPMCMEMTPTLVCLDQSEWKYLPLYAGGLDDGSGGVFNDDVPIAEIGFSTAGPRIHTGTGSSAASSEFDFVGHQDLDSTHHTSTMTNDGFSDQMDHRQIYDGDSDLWEDVHASTTASHIGTGTLVAPSIVDAESEDGFVLPIRTRDPDAAPYHPVNETQAMNAQDDEAIQTMDQDNYEDIFGDSDEEQDDNIDENNEDDDTATEKGEDDRKTSDDEDMVFVERANPSIINF